MASREFEIATIDVVPVRLRLREPFIISYGVFPDVLSVLVRVTDRAGRTGWGEATPDEFVSGESWEGVLATIRDRFAPALIGHDLRRREQAHLEMDRIAANAPAAKAAIDIALHDVLAKIAEIPIWALLGGSGKTRLQISRVVSMSDPDRMAADALHHVADGFGTVKLKVGDGENYPLDIDRVAAVRNAIGPEIGIKIDVNQGWIRPELAIPAIEGIMPYHPDYIEQPVKWDDLEGLAVVRRTTGAPIMVDEGCHGPASMQQVVALEAADLVNIKLMKTGGLLPATVVNGIAQTAGIRSQVGTMVESSIASAAGLHLAMALENVGTVEMGGPLMLAEDIGSLRDWYDGQSVQVPDWPGLGIDIEIEKVRQAASEWTTVRA